jgi:hypothetical protein
LEFNAVAMPYSLRINGVALPIDPYGRVVLQPAVRLRLPARYRPGALAGVVAVAFALALALALALCLGSIRSGTTPRVALT